MSKIIVLEKTNQSVGYKMKLLKDVKRINFKKYQTKERDIFNGIKNRARARIDENKEYSDKKNIIYGLLETIIMIIIISIFTYFYIPTFDSVRNYLMGHGVIGATGFIFYIGLLPILFFSFFMTMNDWFLNISYILFKKDEEKVVKFCVIIGAVAFIISLLIQIVIWNIEFFCIKII